jgi:predicted HTH transcriptional regulator
VVVTAPKDSRSYTEDDIRQFLLQGEGTMVEFKVGVPEPNLLARLIGSFANSSRGVILLGVDERGEIIGSEAAILFIFFTRKIDPYLLDTQRCQL